MSATQPKVCPRGVPLATTNLGIPGNRSSQSLDGSPRSSRKGGKPRSHRGFSSLKNSKFWLRILKPWKWKKRSKKSSRLSRSGSESNRSRNGVAVSPSEKHFSLSPEKYFQAAAACPLTPSKSLDDDPQVPRLSLGSQLLSPGRSVSNESLVSDSKLDISISPKGAVIFPASMATILPETSDQEYDPQRHSDDDSEEIPVNILPQQLQHINCKETTFPVEKMDMVITQNAGDAVANNVAANDDDEEEEDIPINKGFASKVFRRDTMARKLDGPDNDVNEVVDYDVSSSDEEEEKQQPKKRIPIRSELAKRIQRRDTMAKKIDAPDPVDDIPNQTAAERRKIMHRVSLKLERKLSERPLPEELQERNILKKENAESISKENMEQTRKVLLRKLSFRPTISELKDKQIIKFNDYVEVTEAEMYDRKGDKPWTKLTPAEKALIRKELNDFKATEMDVHEASRIYTRFHRP
jgi:hypothetical protein